jgi:hypothetical protein
MATGEAAPESSVISESKIEPGTTSGSDTSMDTEKDVLGDATERKVDAGSMAEPGNTSGLDTSMDTDVPGLAPESSVESESKAGPGSPSESGSIVDTENLKTVVENVIPESVTKVDPDFFDTYALCAAASEKVDPNVVCLRQHLNLFASVFRLMHLELPADHTRSFKEAVIYSVEPGHLKAHFMSNWNMWIVVSSLFVGLMGQLWGALPPDTSTVYIIFNAASSVGLIAFLLGPISSNAVLHVLLSSVSERHVKSFLLANVQFIQFCEILLVLAFACMLIQVMAIVFVQGPIMFYILLALLFFTFFYSNILLITSSTMLEQGGMMLEHARLPTDVRVPAGTAQHLMRFVCL